MRWFIFGISFFVDLDRSRPDTCALQSALTESQERRLVSLQWRATTENPEIGGRNATPPNTPLLCRIGEGNEFPCIDGEKDIFPFTYGINMKFPYR